MTPTAEQLAIVEFAKKSSQSLLVNAFAGAAKTTTLELITKAVTGIPILSLAFNKRIAEEMTTRLPGHVKCQTLNSLGHQVWAAATGRRLIINTKKSYELLKAEADDLSRADKSDFFDNFPDLLKLISKAKLSGYIPEGKFPGSKPLVTLSEFIDSLDLDEPLPRSFIKIIDSVLTASINLSYSGQIDFDDQIYMPTLFGGNFPKFPLVLVDEAQDLSPLNHAMLRKLVTKRLIAVGDPFQSIYGFRGAVHNGMSQLKSTFEMEEKTLSISFRCPIAVVKRARFRAPTMQWGPNAEEGIVETLDEFHASLIPDHAAIICRNNAPLFRCALNLIKQGRGVQLVGADIGPGLVKVLKKLGPSDMNLDQTMAAILNWETETAKKNKKVGSVHDRAECLRVFAQAGGSLGGAVAFAEHLFQSKGPIQLLSGHKAKGLEWDVVYHLDPWRIPSPYVSSAEELDQELNVRYVIETRAKKELYLVSGEIK